MLQLKILNQRTIFTYKHQLKSDGSMVQCFGHPFWVIRSKMTYIRPYCKILNISPGLIEVRKQMRGPHIWGRGLYSEGILC